MTLKSDLQREVDFPQTELNELIDAIIEEVNRTKTEIADDKLKDDFKIANTTGQALSPGTFIGFDSDGNMAVADASDTIIRASFVSNELVPEDAVFTPIFDGLVDVIVGQSVTIGRIGYLSTAAGQAQVTRPSSPDRIQIVGIWAEARIPDTGKAKMTLMIDPVTTRR